MCQTTCALPVSSLLNLHPNNPMKYLQLSYFLDVEPKALEAKQLVQGYTFNNI